MAASAMVKQGFNALVNPSLAMQIDLSVSQQGLKLSPAELEKLSSQMAEILLRLKAPPGRPILVNITDVTPITQAERQALLAQKNNTPPALTDLLKNPASKLIEMRFHKQTFHVITELSLKSGDKLLVTPQADAFSTRTASTATTQPTSQLPEKASPGAPSPASTTLPGNQAPSSAQANNRPSQSIEGHNLARTEPSLAPKPSNPPTSSASDPLSPPLSASGNRISEKSSGALPQTHNPAKAFTGNLTTKTDSQNTPHSPPKGSPSGATLAPEQVKKILQEQFRSNLPLAESLSKLNLANKPALDQFASLPPLPSQITRGTTSSNLQAQQLWVALRALAQISVPVAEPSQVPPRAVAEAITRSGVAQLPPSSTMSTTAPPDAQALLETVVNTVNQLQNQLLAVGKTAAGFSSLDKLLMSFMAAGQPVASKQEGSQTGQVHLGALKDVAAKALAQLQIRQIQSTPSNPTERSPFFQGVTLDIPLRFPDGWFNLVLTVQEPQKRKSASKSRQSAKPAQRWRLLLALELGQQGELSTELQVDEHNLDATMWASNDALRNRAKRHMNLLREGLAEAGIQVGNIVCSEVPPPHQPTHTSTPLIDIET